MILPQVKSFLKYTISLAVALGLFWYVYKDLDVTSSIAKLKGANYSWIVLSIALSIISHLTRAFRWNILLKPAGHTPTLSRTFWAVMVGYLANLVVPRMGEVTRCGILKKTNEVPMTVSIGTVVAERVIDFFTLIVLVILGFIIEFERLNEFLTGFVYEKAALVGDNLFSLYIIAGIGLALLLIVFLLIRIFRKKIQKHPLFLKIRSFSKELVLGITSIRRIDQKVAFWLSTLVIWLMYFLMSYVVIFALESTSALGLGAGIALLIMGGLGMAAPVQGGIGTFHALVAAVLVLYGINEADGQVFAFLLHTSQTITVIFVGSISLIISLVIRKKRNTATETIYAK